MSDGSGMSYMVILTAPQYWHGSFDAGASDRSMGQYAHDGYVSHVELLDDRIFSCAEAGTVKMWDLDSGRFLRDVVRIHTAHQRVKLPAVGDAAVELEADREKVIWRCACEDGQLVCAYGSRERAENEDTHILRIDLLGLSVKAAIPLAAE